MPDVSRLTSEVWGNQQGCGRTGGDRDVWATVTRGIGICLLFLGCSGGQGPDVARHTFAAVVDEEFSSDIVSELEMRGVDTISWIPIIEVVAFRGDAERDFSTLPKLKELIDLGKDEDPDVSVFIRLKSAATDADVEHFREQYGDTPGATAFEPEIIPAVLRLSRVADLSEWDRVEAAVLASDGVAPGD